MNTLQPKLLYYRDDENLVNARIRVTEPPSLAGVCFGWMCEPRDANTEAMFRAYWPQKAENSRWLFNDFFRPLDRLNEVRGLPDVIASISPTASIDEFCRALDSIGFRRYRDADALASGYEVPKA